MLNCLYIESAYASTLGLCPETALARYGAKELVMPDLNEISKTIGGMPFEGLVAIIILAAFGLAAYAIHAVLAVVRGRR
jgi:hypothetical protein